MKTNRSDDDDDACKKRKRPVFVKCWLSIMGVLENLGLPPPFVCDISFDVITLD